jgi:hypothetical protein
VFILQFCSEYGDNVAGFLFEPIQGEAGVKIVNCIFHIMNIMHNLIYTIEVTGVLRSIVLLCLIFSICCCADNHFCVLR